MKKTRRYFRNTMAKLLAAVLLVAMLPVTAYADTVQGSLDSPSKAYQYKVTAESPEWDTLETVDDKIEACRIPKDELAGMSDAELIQAVLDFPFLIEIFAYDDPVMGVKAMENISDAYAELLNHESAETSLLESVRQRSGVQSSAISAKEEIKNDALVTLIIYQDVFRNNLSVSEVQEVADLSTSIDVKSFPSVLSSAQEKLYVYTPNQTPVEYITKECTHSSKDYHAEADKEIVKDYGVTLISPGSCKYNCHSYAWHSQSANNNVYIVFPSSYMLDGSYKKVMSGINSSSINVVSGDRLYYDGLHSAIVTSSATGSPLATRTVKSKWGSCGVFRHTVTNVPWNYKTSNVSAWHR